MIDFGYARSLHQSSKSYNREGLNLNYVASECFNNIYSVQSDIYAVGALMYHLIFGKAPWQKDISKYQEDRTKAEEIILDARSKPLSFPELDSDFIGLEDSVKLILKKALSQDPDYRFSSADEFLKAINGEIEVEDIDKVRKVKSTENNVKKFHHQKVKGKGFEAIAGMSELKEQLQLDVIDALHNPEEYSKYGCKRLLLYIHDNRKHSLTYNIQCSMSEVLVNACFNIICEASVGPSESLASYLLVNAMSGLINCCH
jgi:transitional endoplasmic reticulum ATPase